MLYNEEHDLALRTRSSDTFAIDLPFIPVTTTVSNCETLSAGMVSVDPDPYHIFHNLSHSCDL